MRWFRSNRDSAAKVRRSLKPQVTIGIPAYNRPDLLGRAITSLLAQTEPVKIVVSVQDTPGANPDGIARVVDQYASHPNLSTSSCLTPGLWANWTNAARHCTTPYFAWLQDDDVLAPHAAQRMREGLDLYPDATCYAGRGAIAGSTTRANWWGGNGPIVPMDMLTGHPTQLYGPVLTPACLCTSMAMSPAVAFRWSEAFVEDCERQPEDCGLYYERTILAACGRRGNMVCDPALLGLWLQHDRNESRRLCMANGVMEQGVRQLEWVERELEQIPKVDWEGPFLAWLHIAKDFLRNWCKSIDEFNLNDLPLCKEVRKLMWTARDQLCPEPKEEIKPAEVAA